MFQRKAEVGRQRWLAVLIMLAAMLSSSCSRDSAEQPAPSAASPTSAAVTITVGGMTCAGCAQAITETLQPIPGISSVTVDHATGKAVLVTDGRPDVAEKAAAKIREIGYEASLAP